jgi:hypothetical protein
MALINQGGSVQLTSSLLAASRIDKISLEGYWIIATPKHPDLLESQRGWQLARMDATTKNIDYPRGGDGKATDDFVFTYAERAGLIYGAAGL